MKTGPIWFSTLKQLTIEQSLNLMIENISFIVIALNEEFAVDKCLNSILSMHLKNCEVIAVDSNSTDNTLEVMKSYGGRIENIRIIQISGYINAAVARNAGLKYATKEKIFFVDGDVELFPEFIDTAMVRIDTGRADAVTGKLLEIQYTADYQKEIRKVARRKHMLQEETCLLTGGIFITTRKIVERVGTWNDNYIRFQDMNYTLRISRIGSILQLPEFIGIHHSQEFHDRSWEHFTKGYTMLYGMLLRENIDRPLFFISLLRANRGLATFILISSLLVLSSFAAAILPSFTFHTLALIAASCVLIDCVYSTIVKHFNIKQWLLHNYLTPIIMIFGFFNKTKCTEKQTKVEIIA
jgi:glycosyltransferase involved in cell wall biosynthesis